MIDHEQSLKMSSSDLEQRLASSQTENLTLQQKIEGLTTELHNMVHGTESKLIH